MRWWVLLLLLQLPLISAETAVLTADSVTATRGLADPENALGAFDDAVALTAAWQSTGDTALFTMSNFTENGTVLNLTIAMRMNATLSWANDHLSMQYSNDSGTTWFTAVAGLQPPAALTTYGNYTTDIVSGGGADALQVRLSLTKNQGPDGMQSGIDGAEVYVVYAPPPSVVLAAPANDSWQNGLVQFSFTPASLITLSGCSLIINGTLNQSNQTLVTNGLQNTIEVNLAEGVYAWNVECMDSSGFTGAGSEDWMIQVDAVPPVVQLQDPANDSLYRMEMITFAYNVSDAAQVSNCSILINGTVNATDTGIIRDLRQEFLLELESGSYEWRVSCTDEAGLTGLSEPRALEVQVHPPLISLISSPGVIVLNAGTTKRIECNFTAYDEDGADDIIGANASFYLPPDTGTSPDDNRSHYANASCAVQSQTLTTKDFGCSVQLYYYAQNGSWYCEGTAESVDGIGSAIINFTVDPLYALDIGEPVLDFGTIIAGVPSAELEEPVRNVGNLPLTVAVRAGLPGEGVAVMCDTVNVSADYMRYALSGMVIYGAKSMLTGTLTSTNLTLDPQHDSALSASITYWQLMVPENVSDTGECVGSILFQAESE